MYHEWSETLKDCLLDPHDLKEDNTFELFKILYQNTKDMFPNYALQCAKDAIVKASKEQRDNDYLSPFNLNVMFFKTKASRFIQEQLGNPIPKR